MPAFSYSPGVTDEDSDNVLLERLTRGDHAAFTQLVQRHTTRFYRVAYRFIRNRSETEDIVQDAFLKLWEKPHLWQAGKNTAFTTWFYRIVVNQCLDYAKKKRPVALEDDSWVEDSRQSHEQELLDHEKQRALEQAIAQLPERQRVALTLCFYEGLSNQEAADIMRVRLKALQALLMRAKTELKNTLKHYGAGIP